MPDRDEIVRFLDELLDVAAYPDFCPTGLQVPGAQEVTRVVCAVSSSLALFRRAAELGAQMVVVHHGLFWEKDPRRIDLAMRERLRALFDADISLVAHHLALDAHPEVGNNALLCRALGVTPEARFSGVGFGGALTAPCTIEELCTRVEAELGRRPLLLGEGPATVRRVAICSGAAARSLGEAIAAGYDAFLTGEPSEPALMTAREAGIHFLAGGHYATETLGVQALGATLAERFGVEWSFVDLPNPV
ncbi:MAG: Nif3-like dinuclear metal center hexameric protein [Thermoleophilia bacterium]